MRVLIISGLLLKAPRVSSIKIFLPFSKTLSPRHLLLWAEHTAVHNQAEMFEDSLEVSP